MLRSLRSRVIGGMALLVALVFVIALLGVNSIRALDQSVERELSLLMESTDLGNGLVSSVASEIRSAEQYLVRPASTLRLRVLEEGDSAYALQRRYRGLASLTTAEIRSALEGLQQAYSAAGAAIYQAQQASGAGADAGFSGGATAGAGFADDQTAAATGAPAGQEDVVEADYEIVEDEKK